MSQSIEELQEMLQSFGFSDQAIQEAIINNGVDMELCLAELINNQQSADIAPISAVVPAPVPVPVPVSIPAPVSAPARVPTVVSAAAPISQHDPMIQTLIEMGFTFNQAQRSIQHCGGNNVEACIQWILTMPEQQEEEEQVLSVISPSLSTTKLSSSHSQSSSSSSSSFVSPSANASAKTSTLSDEARQEIITNQLLQQAIFLHDITSVNSLIKQDPTLLKETDARGNTPLHLAVYLQDAEIISALLSAGADPRIKNDQGWSALQEATIRHLTSVSFDLYLHQVIATNQEWQESLPMLLQTLNAIPDFYMEIKFEIASWIPLISQRAPSDTFKLWKKGAKLRFDSTLRGIRADMQPELGHTSFLFTNRANGVGVYLVDHVRQSFEDALLKFRNPPIELINREVTYMLCSDNDQIELSTNGCKSKLQTSLLGGVKTERVGEWNCQILEVNGLKFRILRRSANDENQISPIPDYEEYFSSKPNAASKQSGIIVAEKDIEAQVYLSREFPFNKSNLLSILDLIAPASAELAKLKNIFALPSLPDDSFPVRLVVPIFPGISAKVTFGNHKQESCNDDIFHLPSFYQQHF